MFFVSLFHCFSRRCAKEEGCRTNLVSREDRVVRPCYLRRQIKIEDSVAGTSRI